MGAEWEMEAAVEELGPLKVKDMISVGKDREELLRFVALDAENARSSAGIIINTSDALESRELEKLRGDLSLPVFAVGPLHKFEVSPLAEAGRSRSSSSCMEWLDSQAPRSVVYVSFGSLASMGCSDFREMAWGLVNSGRPFLWAIRRGSVNLKELHDVHLPDGLELDGYLSGKGKGNINIGKGKIVEWAPQRAVLAHGAVGAFWTHCGWNSTLEALTEGVPLLCTPFFSDQMGNTRYVADVWKLGLELRVPLDRGRVQGAIHRMLGDDMRLMRARAQQLQRLLSDATLEGGSSCQAAHHLLSFLSSL